MTHEIAGNVRLYPARVCSVECHTRNVQSAASTIGVSPVQLAWKHIQTHPREAWKIAGMTARNHFDRVIARLKLDGLVGYGESAPADIFGESPGTVERFLRRLKRAGLPKDPLALAEVEDRLRRAGPGNSSAKAAVEMAVHDLYGPVLKRPLYEILGLDPAKAPATSFSIGIDDLPVMRRKVREARRYPILKIKVGTPYDEEIIRMIRRELPRVTLRVDANAGWTREEAARKMNVMDRLGVEFVEQPLRREDLAGLAWLKTRTRLPVILDESVMTPSDLPGMSGLCAGINLKLMKCGGLREALRFIHTARACGLKIMMGCMIETSLAITAGSHLAALLDYADMDGALLLSDDPFRGANWTGGRLKMGKEAGLGVTPVRADVRDPWH